MQLTNATNAVSEHVAEGHSVSAPSALSEMERIFVDAFVGNGGKGEEAALAAGYAASSAKVSACRLLCRQRVAALIKSRCETFAHSMLPVAVKALLDICETAALPKDRIKAANSLIELAGMVAPKGPGVQVNFQINGQQAQAIIAEVHDAKARRLSDIPPAMPDTLEADFEQIEQLAIGPPPATPGGDQLQGPGPGSRPLPVSPPEQSDISDVSEPAPADAFRRAFDEEEDDAD